MKSMTLFCSFFVSFFFKSRFLSLSFLNPLTPIKNVEWGSVVAWKTNPRAILLTNSYSSGLRFFEFSISIAQLKPLWLGQTKILIVFSIAFSADTEFSRLSLTSIGFIFLIYILVNVSMVVGVLPVVGLPLPLISQGGTSIIMHLMAFGFVLSMKKRQTW